MVTSDPRDVLVLAHVHARQLHDAAAAERLRRGTRTRRALAESLRRAANRLDSQLLAHGRA